MDKFGRCCIEYLFPLWIVLKDRCRENLGPNNYEHLFQLFLGKSRELMAGS